MQEYFCKKRSIINIYRYVYEIQDVLFIKKIENGGKREREHPNALLVLVNERNISTLGKGQVDLQTYVDYMQSVFSCI